MQRDWKRARAIATSLTALKDTLAKQDAPKFDAEEFRAILDTICPDTVVNRGELDLVWLYYNQQRGEQLATAPLRSHKTEDENRCGLSLLFGTRELPKVPAELQGLERLKRGIEMAIFDDIKSDAQKWAAIATEDQRENKKTQENGGTLIRDKKEEERAAQCLFNRKITCVHGMLKNHVRYWSQEPHVEGQIPDLGEVFWILSSDTETRIQELRSSWYDYERHRRRFIDFGEPHRVFTQEEKDVALSREWPAWCRGAVPNNQETRDALEAHIRTSIAEDIVADRIGWERLRRKEEEIKQRHINQRPERIARYRDQFTSKILETFGQEVLDLISEDDIAAYSQGMADRSASRDKLWNNVIDKYDFDQKTSSCLYFIRQGAAVKIGITGNLEKRFAQIRTSASQPCKIENVVYTHFGEILERKLHHTLAEYNTHLEWFVLPPWVEEILFNAKSKMDIERFVHQLAQGSNR